MKNILINKILVPIDFTETSKAALIEAAEVAKLSNSELYLIHIIQSNDNRFTNVPEMQSIYPGQAEIEAVVEKEMFKLQEWVNNKWGILPQTVIINGHVYSEIINFSEKNQIDIIFMGTNGASGFHELFIGSNAQKVVANSNVPVLTLQKTKENSGFGHIVIPIDNSLHSREKINIAMQIADLFKSEIHLIGLPDSKEEHEADKFRIKLDSIVKIIKESNLKYRTSIVYGDSLAESAMKYATENNCDLIVINTGHESRISNLFLGAFAEKIVNHSTIPVLSVKHMSDHFEIESPSSGIS